MKFNDFKIIMHKICNNVYFSADDNGLYMALDVRGDVLHYPLDEEYIKSIEDKYSFVFYVMKYLSNKNEFDTLKDNFIFDRIDDTWDHYDFNVWYPEEYDVTDNGIDDGVLNVYLKGELIGEISSSDRHKEQPYKYIQPLKNVDACNEFIMKCHEIWLESKGEK